MIHIFWVSCDHLIDDIFESVDSFVSFDLDLVSEFDDFLELGVFEFKFFSLLLVLSYWLVFFVDFVLHGGDLFDQFFVSFVDFSFFGAVCAMVLLQSVFG